MARIVESIKLLDALMQLKDWYPHDCRFANDCIDLAIAKVMSIPAADVQAFFTEDEIALINEYKDAVKAVDFKTAILNAVSVALDRVDYEPTEEDTHDRFSEFANAQDALKPLLARFKGGKS